MLTEHASRSAGMQVDLSLFAARTLFRVRLDWLANRVVPLEGRLGREAPLLLEQLVELPPWEERFRLLDAVLARRLGEGIPPPREVVWAYERLRRSGGRLAVAEHVGVAPKTFARVCRFTHALALVGRGDLGWAELALECGYYDQAHLVNEFRAFAGTTPTRHDAFLHDTAAAGA